MSLNLEYKGTVQKIPNTKELFTVDLSYYRLKESEDYFKVSGHSLSELSQ